MLIKGKDYRAEEAYNEVLNIPDCWVCSSNTIGNGHGEAKLYYGPKTRLGEVFEKDASRIECFVIKEDLISLLELLKVEYLNPKEKYKSSKDFKRLYEERFLKVDSFPDSILPFEITNQKQISGRRGYIKSGESIYHLLREIALPNLCYLSIMRLVNTTDDDDKIYYWKINVDFKLLFAKNRKKAFSERYGKGSAQEGSRPAQPSYRKKLIAEFGGECAVTKADEPQILVASHIKPYKVSSEKERKDPNNGILLSSLYDRLFDRGFITFNPEGKMLISSWLSIENRQKLNVHTNSPSIPLSPEREEYLVYHRKFIFKGILD